MTGPAYIGVEGGGSTSKAALYYAGRTLARIDQHGLNPADLGYRAFETRLNSLLSPILADLGRVPGPIRACVALAGVGRQSVAARCKAITRDLLKSLGWRPYVMVMTDADLIIESYLKGRDGIALIAGTGSICVGVRQGGRESLRVRAGGWGGFLDDGSGFNIGMGVLREALRTVDGRRKRGMMVDLLCDRYGIGLDEIREKLLPAVRERIAPLAEIALEGYASNDPVAKALVRGAVSELVKMVLAVKERAKLDDRTDVFLSGGLFRSMVVRRLFGTKIRRALSGVRIHQTGDTLLQVLRIARNYSPGNSA
jgi:N-acetylglucosamine kinase-like BadF-type ATPase